MKPDWQGDKRIEQERYDRRAAALLAEVGGSALGADGSESVRLTLRAPYRRFEQCIREAVEPGAPVLDVCCGTGRFSLVAAGAGGVVTAVDIATQNLAAARRRAGRAGLPLTTTLADAERLPFADGAFAVVSCAGSLSYVDLGQFLREVRRVLRPGGRFVCVDSLDHNPVYRLNRRLQYWRGRRTQATLARMPTLATIDRIRREIGEAEVSYHGVLSFLAPVLERLVGAPRAARWLDAVDARWAALHPLAFKFVLVARRTVA